VTRTRVPDFAVDARQGGPGLIAVTVTRMSERPLFQPGEAGVIDLTAETQFAPNGIVSRTIFTGGSSRLVLFGFDAGQELTEHTSPHHALVQILSGRCEFTLAGKPRELKAGDLLYMPPGLPHAVKALERFSMLLTLA
jgi:quercetin dioxygenase-like cupin family protein